MQRDSMPDIDRRPRALAALALFVIGGMVVAVAPAAAAPTPTASPTPYTDILNNLYTVVYRTLKYAGLIALGGGAIVWFLSGNERRSAFGQRLFVGGAVMEVLYFGFSSVIAVLRWIATNGGA